MQRENFNEIQCKKIAESLPSVKFKFDGVSDNKITKLRLLENVVTSETL